MTKPSLRWKMSRRGFLIGIGTTAAVVAVGWVAGKDHLRRAISDLAEGTEKAVSRGAPAASPTQWLSFSADNILTVHVQKIEMGQGILTALAQIAAEELNLPWENVRVVMDPTGSPVQDPNGTGNSESVVSHYLPLRTAAATLREMLARAAATQLNVAVATLTHTGTGFATEAGVARTYGEVVAAHTGEWTVPTEAPTLKDAATFTLIGTPKKRIDIPDKVTGNAIYGHDVRLPNMAWGVIARPRIIGAVIDTVDQKDAATLPGVVKVVVDGTFVGVVAETKAQAQTALNAMQIEWKLPEPLVSQAAIDAATTVDPTTGVEIQRDGDAHTALAAAPKVYTREFRTPMAAHAHLEPQASVVDVRSDGVDAWVSTQVPAGMANAIAAALNRDVQSVIVHPVYLGGGFGRRLDEGLGVEAARLSAAAQRPVAIAWSRADEFHNGYVRPPTHHVMRGSLSADGTIEALSHHQASGDVLLTIFPPAVGTFLGWDIGAVRGAKWYYTASAGRLMTAQRVALPVATSFWRGLGLLADGFAIESFIDELAEAAGTDALAFRLKHLPNSEFGTRMKATLEAVATRAGWQDGPPAGHAFGLACSADAGTCVAQIADVSIENGEVRVHHVYAAVDCGLVINPDGVVAQTEGGIMMGVSSTLIEALTVVDGAFGASNFDRYPLLRNRQAPDITVVIVPSSAAPGGMGEPPIGPIAGAIANAVYRLTGTRPEQLPISVKG